MSTRTLGGILLAASIVAGHPILGAPCDTSGPGTPLGNAADNLGAGEWCSLAPDGDSVRSVLDCCAGSALTWCTTYPEDMEWDPINNKLRYVGAPHHGQQKHFVYDAATNVWGTDSPQDPRGCPSSVDEHGYDHNALDPATGDLYYHRYGSYNTYKFNGTSWAAIDTYPQASTSITWGTEWFPERKELVISDGRGRLSKWESGKGWTVISSSILPNDTYHQAIEYNPVHNLLWIYGGNGATDHYRYDSDGVVTRLGRSTHGLGLTNARVSVDPVGGDFLLFWLDGTWRSYDITTDTWSPISHSMPPIGDVGQGNIAADDPEAAIEEYGVIVWLDYKDNTMYVYKHDDSSGGEPTPPLAPDGLLPTGDESK